MSALSPSSFPFWALAPMHLQRAVRMGLKSLWVHRLRSLLTVLGIVFGVCSVIAMLAIGEGASYEAQEQIKSLGSQNIIIRSLKPAEEQKVSEKGSESFVLEYGLTQADLRRIQRTIPGVTVLVPARVMREFVSNVSRRLDCDVVGTVPWYPTMRNHPVARGRFFNDADMAASANVCVLGAEVARTLFPFDSPLGRDVSVSGDYYRVIGVMGRQSAASRSADAGGGDTGAKLNRIFIPLETARSRFGEILLKQRSGSIQAERVALHEVTVKVAGLDEVLTVADAIKTLLQRHHPKKDYEIVVPLEMLKQAERTKRIFNIVLGSIAAISLLVGGIGIMNIMLASVTERTREIGIRRALGAKRRDIIAQFLFETVLLAGVGGLIGVALGIAVPFLVGHFAGMRTIVTLWAPLVAFGISGLVGLVFGIYPAQRAASMDPVEALRHE